MPKAAIDIKNAHQNNLKNLDLALPLGELIVVTGVSGSGKSTLAFDTVYAEGQRRYVETFSPYARQFLDRMDKPQVDSIEGIPPAIAIDQINPVRTSRSTVGTMTELNDYLKLLFARLSTLYCYGCGKEVRADTAQRITNEWMQSGSERLMVTFKISVPSNFSSKEIEDWLDRQGYKHIHRTDGGKTKKKSSESRLEVVQDRMRITPDNSSRLIEALEAALRYGNGHISVYSLNDKRESGREHKYSTELACAGCAKSFSKPLPSRFSFNSPIGACETCRGFGRTMGIDYALVIPDENLTLREGAVKVWQSKTNAICQRDMIKFGTAADIPLDKPWNKLSARHKQWVIEGDKQKGRRRQHWYGIQGFFKWLEGRAYKMHVRVMLSKYRSYEECGSCKGARLKPESLQWRIGSLDQVRAVIKTTERFKPLHCELTAGQFTRLPGLCLHDLMCLPLSDVQQFFQSFDIEQSTNGKNEALDLLLSEIRSRVRFLNDVGLGYLSLDRQSRTLSGGEVQRINLTTALGTSLVNTLFVLDEPSIGLHARDIDRVARVLKRLRDAGNTLVVVEHDPQLMFAADRIIDMGPGPGKAGGEVVYNGSPARLLNSRKSLTGEYLSGRRELVLENKQNSVSSQGTEKRTTKRYLEVHGARQHNLKNITVKIPLGKLVCVTGPSGSGKSTLVQDVLYNAVTKLKGKPADPAGQHDNIVGDEHIESVVLIDQTPIGKSARSNPVSYTGAFEAIRKLFASEPESKSRGLTAGSFSFNSGMRCPACSGNGFEHVEMQFLSDVYIRCGECNGSRYRPEILEIKVFSTHHDDGKSIADVLHMTVDQALEFFADENNIINALRPLSDVGLGYVELGQPVPTLSGGESQRLKLAAHLGKGLAGKHKTKKSPAKQNKRTGRSNSTKDDTAENGTLFVFDEPTTGLHFHDINKLLGAFRQLLDFGHSLVVVEHNLDVIENAEWIIDMGPDGGDAGGRIVYAGTLANLRKKPKGATADALAVFADAGHDMRKLAASLADDSKDSAYKLAENQQITLRDRAQKNQITLHQAREHNLKNIDVDIPHEKMTVVTGMSGSGKSTIAFDIVFHEGQRRYLESLNAYARQFVQPASRPEVDAVYGIPPTVAIEQRTSRGGQKSTVATMTEIYHFLRLLFVKLGTQYCPDCEVPISAQSIDAIAAQVMKKWRNKRVRLLAPLIVSRKGYYTDLAKWAAKKGFTELRVDGDYLPTENWPRLDRFSEHNIDLPVVDIDISPKTEKTLISSLQRALDFGKGVIMVETVNARGKKNTAQLFSTERACPNCHTSFRELDPRMFSYNSSHGWCQECFGTGRAIDDFDEEQTGEEEHWLEQNEESMCHTCEGQRLSVDSLNVFFKDRSIADFAALSVADAWQVFDSISLGKRESQIARDVLVELVNRLRFLNEVGLSYLTLDRSAPSLSGGEAQRIRLAAQLGSNLRGVCYILDEPTIGLHPRDNAMLLDTLDKLGNRGNTILVVEHDEDTIKRADHVIDIGPGAGIRGGEIVATGSVASIKRNSKSITGRWLDKPLQHPLNGTRRKVDRKLSVVNARLNNLNKVSVDIPLDSLVLVSGVSGSGKSSLIRDVLHDNLQRLYSGKRKPRKIEWRGCDEIKGCEQLGRVLEVDQTPIGKTPRSCPATYIGFWDNIRRVFSNATESRIRGYTPSRFSFNVKGGRCDECDGQGMKRIEMNFLPDVRIACDVCNGMRFNSETLSARYRDHSIGDVLNMDVDTALDFFRAHTGIHHPLQLLQDVGLGYLTLGQPSPTLSGGEAQRVKLVSELAKVKSDPDNTNVRKNLRTGTLYVLDEPTVGLHMADVDKLIRVLHRLVDTGNSVIVIEHNLDLIAEADWLIDMGPEGGSGGGRIVVNGTPEKVVRSKRSRTAEFLKPVLSR